MQEAKSRFETTNGGKKRMDEVQADFANLVTCQADPITSKCDVHTLRVLISGCGMGSGLFALLRMRWQGNMGGRMSTRGETPTRRPPQPGHEFVAILFVHSAA